MKQLSLNKWTSFKQWLTLALVVVSAVFANAQQVSIYQPVVSTGTYTAVASPDYTLGSATMDDQEFVNPTSLVTGSTATGPGFPLGFTVTINGVAYDKIGISANGHVTLGAASSATMTVSTAVSTAISSTPPTGGLVLAALAADLQGQTGSAIYLKSQGTAPNREYIVEWNNVRRYFATGDAYTFQLRIGENGTISSAYNVLTTLSTSYTAAIGMRQAADFTNATGTWANITKGTTSTSTVNYTGGVTSGTTITWTIPACPPPSITISGQTTTSLSYAITSFTGSTYEIEYGLQGFTQGQGTVVAATATGTITGLNPSSSYDLYVRNNCTASSNGYSSWTGPVVGSTVCSVVSTFPFNQGFDAWSTGTTVGLCYTSTPSSSGGPTWTVEDFATPSSSTGPLGPQSGARYMFIETSNGLAGSVAHLEFPEFNTTSLTSPELRFFYHMYGATTNKLRIESYNGTAWVAIDSIIGQQQTSSSAAWLERIVPIPTAASVKIRFAGYRGTSFTGDISIDNVTVQQTPPSCPVNDTLAVVGATTCGNSSVTLSASGASGNSTIVWTNTASKVVGTGSTFTTPVITATTSYGAQSFADDNTLGDVNFGPSSALGGGFGNFTNGQWFTALAPFRLDSITVKSNGPATFALRVSEAGGSIATGNSGALLQQSQWISVPAAGTHKVAVGMYILPGSYYLNFTWQTGSGLLHRATAGAVYPYTAAGVATIDSVQFGSSTSQVRVYYAYDWVVSKGCVGPVTTGTATWAAVPSTAIPYSVDFNGGLPCNWTTSSNTTQNWNVVSTYGTSSLNGSSFLFFDDDIAGGSAAAVDASATSPVVNTLGYDSVTVSFDHYYFQYPGTAGYVEVYNGSAWVAIDTFTTTQGSWAVPATANYDVTAMANANMQVRLRYSDGTGTWGWYWAVDNFEIDGNVLPCTNVRVAVTTDIYGSEVTWSIRDVNTGIVWATGGPYADVTPYNAAAATHIDTLCLPDNGTYEFQINDSYGDGLFDGTNTGTYTVDKLCSWGWNNVTTGSGAQAYGSTTNPPSYDSVVFDMNCIQLKNVTFQVDMNQVTAGFTTPEVNGFWNNWCGNCNAMSDANGDGIWEVTIPLEVGTTQEFKYSADAWTIQEMNDPTAPCTNGNATYTNRVLVVPAADTTLPVVCWSSCFACTVDVTLQVNMAWEVANNAISADGIHVAGDFQGWNPGATAMTDANNDGIYEVTINVPANSSIQYKFINGNAWGQDEPVPGACAVTGTTNRGATFAYGDSTMAPVCFGKCTDCMASLDETLQNVSLFPNPTRGQFNLARMDAASEVEVSVLDLQGKVLTVATWNAGAESLGIDLGNFANGVYMVRLTSEEGSRTLRVSVQK
jgi:hypothetical protein